MASSTRSAALAAATCLLATVLFCQLAQPCQSASVMSLDLGSEWLKVGVVAPSIPMEIALNKESKRKTPAVLAFRDGQRIFGEDAQTIGLRFPDKSYSYITDLLGKRADNPIVALYQKRFPYHTIEQDEERQTLVFRTKPAADGSTEAFTIEELVAQFIQKAREQAEAATGQQVTECVLIVPGFFGQAERRSLLAAASLVANLKVLQLINDYTAVALNYGIFARKDFNETAQYYMFYDMGAAKTSAALVSYQLVKDKATRETNPVISVLGVGYDRTLGGLEMQLRLRDHLAGEFNALKKTATDVRTNARAMAKLFKEAGRVKNVLSANANHYAQIEGLLEEHDFKVLVKREEFEALCADLFDRVERPVKRALEAAGLPMDVVRQVILFGGGTRVPRVQERLRAVVGQELGKNINMDEAAAMGAVYRAADLATGFKVKKFVTRDAALFPIQVAFDREREATTEAGGKKQVRRSLFAAMNAYPQKKVITFNRHREDFAFQVQYADLTHLGGADEVAALGSLQLAKVELRQVAEVLAKELPPVADDAAAASEDAPKKSGVESKGIRAHFVLDDSGVFELSSVELVVEKTVLDGAEAEEESPLSKLGSTISKLFSSDKGEPAEGDEPVKDEEPSAEEAAPAGKDGEDVGEKPTGGEEEAKPAGSEEEPAAAGNQTEAGNAETNKTAPAAPKAKVVTVKHSIPNTVHQLYAPTLAGDRLEAVRSRIDEIAAREQLTVRRETALNALETYVIEANQRLDEPEYAECASAEEAEAVRTACAAVSDWLYEDGETADAETYEKRLAELRKLTAAIYARHWEHQERPEAVKTLRSLLKSAAEFHKGGANFTKEENAERDVFTRVELDTLGSTIAEAGEWLEAELKAQSELARSAPVRLTVKSLTDQMAKVDREVKYLVNKLKIWKPKVAKKEAKKETPAGKKAKAAKKEAKSGVEEAEAEKPVVEEVVEEPEIAVEEPQEVVVEEKVEEKKADGDNKGENHSEL